MIAACSDAPTAAPVDTTPKVVNQTSNACTNPLTLNAGQVIAGVTGTSICVSGGASGAEYALIPYYGSAQSNLSTTLDFTAAGTVPPGASASLAPSASASFDVSGASTPLSSGTYHESHEFETTLRNRERASLRPFISAARAARRSTSGARFDVLPASPSIGQLLQLNTNADSECTAPVYHTGRVVAITKSAVVIADTLNPAGGYSDDEYASLAVSFDTLVDPLDRQAFGDPSDIDHNGKIVLFFTKAVNDLTPASSQSYIGGFFYARDLFPTKSTTDFSGCAGSNVGEMFYVMVPDPKRGGAFSKTNVASEVLGTVAHEYQHLINASRRMYVNTDASDFEETWLNEGLSHIAEELLFYRVSGLKPRQDIDATAIRSSTKLIDAFNSYQSDNIGRYREYIASPSKYSAISDNDSLETRGATWSFLRDAADKLASSDGDIWYRLVNSTSTGLTNLRSVFGNNVVTTMRDFGTSVLTDDISSVDAAYQQPGWNFRSIFAALGSSSFPVTSVPLSAGTRSISLVAGSTAYLRFSVTAGSTASVQWPVLPQSVQVTLVRTK